MTSNAGAVGPLTALVRANLGPAPAADGETSAPAPPSHDPDLIPDVDEPTLRPEQLDFDRALAELDIVDVYRLLGVKGYEPRRSGHGEWKIRCPSPAHEDRDPSASANPTKGTNGGVFKCHSANCGATGDKFDLAALHLGLPDPAIHPKTFPALKERVAEAAGIPVPDRRTAATTSAGPITTTSGAAPAVAATPPGAPMAPSRTCSAVTPPGSGHKSRPRLHPGGAWILDAPAAIPAIWGRDEEVLWAEGEPFLLVGPDGVGKTTVAQQLLLARCGLADSLLGFPVRAEERRVLLVAADRPKQARRSMARMVEPADRAQLDERLVVHEGPLPADLGLEPAALLQVATAQGAGTVVIDSLKDLAVDLSSDEVGSRVARAFQLLIAEGIEVLCIHHTRKQQAGALEDVYGSRWITAVSGSVGFLNGHAGDPVVTFGHVKQPGERIPNLKLIHDSARGRTTVQRRVDIVALVEASPAGLTLEELAAVVEETTTPTKAQREALRKRLTRLVGNGEIREVKGSRGGAGGGVPTKYLPI